MCDHGASIDRMDAMKRRGMSSPPPSLQPIGTGVFAFFGAAYSNTTASYLSLSCRVFAQHIVDRWHSIAGIELTLNSAPFPFPDKPHHGCCYHDMHVSDAQFSTIFSLHD